MFTKEKNSEICQEWESNPRLQLRSILKELFVNHQDSINGSLKKELKEKLVHMFTKEGKMTYDVTIYMVKDIHLESGALDRSAILTALNSKTI